MSKRKTWKDRALLLPPHFCADRSECYGTVTLKSGETRELWRCKLDGRRWRARPGMDGLRRD